MQVNVEKLSPVLLEFQIEIPADRVKNEVDKAYAAIQRTARVKGFRQGKAPRHVLAHLYGGSIHADVARRLVDTTLNEALATKQVQPLSQPAIAPAELHPENPFSFKARFEVRPEIETVAWEGFEVKRPSTSPTEAMIDTELSNLRRVKSHLEAPATERESQEKDVVRFSFRLEVGGKLQDDKEQEMETELGTGEVFKELETALTGMKPSETKDVTITFSANHPNAELRGKDGTFHVTLKDVKERIYPAIDDELAKDCGSDDLVGLKKQLSDRIEKELKQKAEEVVAEQLVLELCKANTIPVPPSLVEQQAQLTERELLQQARRAGQRLDAGGDFKARVRADAEMKVRAGLLMAEIAKAKSVQITPEDIEKGYHELAEQTGKNVAKVKAEYRDQKKQEMLLGMIMEDKILDLIEAAAKVSEA
jgi:trigger factor